MPMQRLTIFGELYQPLHLVSSNWVRAKLARSDRFIALRGLYHHTERSFLMGLEQAGRAEELNKTSLQGKTLSLAFKTILKKCSWRELVEAQPHRVTTQGALVRGSWPTGKEGLSRVFLRLSRLAKNHNLCFCKTAAQISVLEVCHSLWPSFKQSGCNLIL